MGYQPGTVPVAAQVVPSGPAAPVGYAVMVSEGGGGREGEMEGWMDGWMDGGKEGGREGGREGGPQWTSFTCGVCNHGERCLPHMEKCMVRD